MNHRLHLTTELWLHSAYALLLVLATTFLLLLIGRRELGEGVIALLYLMPVIWSGYRWGQGPGMAAAVVAGLCFDFLFIPPFYTFTIGSLEGWLILAIFMAVAVVLVGRFDASLVRAREMTYLYEMLSTLSDARTPDAVARATASYIQQLFQAALVHMHVYQSPAQAKEIMISAPESVGGVGKPDRQIPILNDWGLVGEIQIWQGEFGPLPDPESRLFQEIAREVGRALERAKPEALVISAGGFKSIPSAN